MNFKGAIAILSLIAIWVSSSPIFAAQINFTPTAIVTEEYNDNIFRDSNNEEDDFITSTGVNLAGDILWPTAGFSLNYQPTYQFYYDNSNQSSWRHGAGLQTYKEYKRNTRFSLDSNFLYTDNPGDSSNDRNLREGTRNSIEDDRNRRNRRKRYNINSRGNISHRFGADDELRGGLNHRILREIDVPSDRDKNDNDVWEPFLGLTYWLNVRWGVELNGLYSNRTYKDDTDREEYTSSYRLRRRFTRHFNGFVEYRNTVLNFDGNQSDYVVHAPAAGIEYQLDENTDISLGAGYYIQDRDNDSTETGYFTESSIIKRWPYRRGFVTLTGSSGYRVDDEGEEDLGLDIYYRAGLGAGYNFHATAFRQLVYQRSIQSLSR